MSIHQFSLKIAQQMVDDEDEQDRPSAFQRALPWLAGAAGIAGAGYLGYQALKGAPAAPSAGDLAAAAVRSGAALAGKGIAAPGNFVGGAVPAGLVGGVGSGIWRGAKDWADTRRATAENLPLKDLSSAMARARAGSTPPTLGRLRSGMGLGDASDQAGLKDRDAMIAKLPSKDDPLQGAPEDVKGTEWGRKLDARVQGMTPSERASLSVDVNAPSKDYLARVSAIRAGQQPGLLGQLANKVPFKIPFAPKPGFKPLPTTVQEGQGYARLKGNPDMADALESAREHFGPNNIRGTGEHFTRIGGAAATGALATGAATAIGNSLAGLDQQ